LRTDATIGEKILEGQALVKGRVDIGRADVRGSKGAGIPAALVVGENDYDIGQGLGRRIGGESGAGARQQREDKTQPRP
jgi:hypothetical protein